MHRNLMIASALLVASVFPAFAADDANRSPASTVDPAVAKGDTPGARPATPGTVGAMDNAGGGSFTASQADQKKNPLEPK